MPRRIVPQYLQGRSDLHQYDQDRAVSGKSFYGFRTDNGIAAPRHQISISPMKSFGGQSMVAPLRRVIVKRPEEALRAPQPIETELKPSATTPPPGLARASHHHAPLL